MATSPDKPNLNRHDKNSSAYLAGYDRGVQLKRQD